MKYERSVLITGGTAGLGYHAALTIAKAHPEYLIVISSRSDKNNAAHAINNALRQDNVVFAPLDLFSSENIRDFAKQWAEQRRPDIQGLVLNAGLQFPGPLSMSPEGIESTFAVNHVGHALLFHLLWPHLADGARIAVTSSGTHDPEQKTNLPDAVYNTAEDLAHPPADMVDVKGRQRYASSKLANVMWTYALNRRLQHQTVKKNVTVNAFDPGLMPGTGLARQGTSAERVLWFRVLPRILPVLRLLISPNIHTPEESGSALARLADDTDLAGETGKYFEGTRAIKSSEASYLKDKQDDLWSWTVKYLARSEEEMARFDDLK